MPSSNSAVPATLHGLYQLVHSINGNPDQVFDEACIIFPGITRASLVGKTRTHELSRVRHFVMFVLRDCYDLTLEAIGKMFGNRDHTTVLYGVNRVDHELSRPGIDRDLFRRSIKTDGATEIGMSESPIVDCRDSFYHLGDVRVFPSLSAGVSYVEGLRTHYRSGFRHGPAIDITSRRFMDSPLGLGLYFHNQATFESTKRKQDDAPILGTPQSLTLEEAFQIRNR